MGVEASTGAIYPVTYRAGTPAADFPDQIPEEVKSRRVKRMQEHSRRLVSEQPPPAPPTEEKREEAPSSGSGLAALFGGDGEQTLIVLLAVLLAKNGAPIELVVALLYIAM